MFSYLHHTSGRWIRTTQDLYLNPVQRQKEPWWISRNTKSQKCLPLPNEFSSPGSHDSSVGAMFCAIGRTECAILLFSLGRNCARGCRPCIEALGIPWRADYHRVPLPVCLAWQWLGNSALLWLFVHWSGAPVVQSPLDAFCAVPLRLF